MRRDPRARPSLAHDLALLTGDVRKLQARGLPPARLLGVVLGGGIVDLGGGKQLTAHGGTALRIEHHIPAGSVVHVDYGHVQPFDGLWAQLHKASGWDVTDKVEEPWERNPWNGSVGLSGTGASPIDYSPLTFTGAVALSVGTSQTGDTVTWTHPVSAVEQASIDTSNGHFGYLFHDFGAAVTSGETHFTASYAGSHSCWTLMGNQHRNGSAAIAVDPTVIASANSGENALGLTLADDLIPGDILVIVSACERDTAKENSSSRRPRIWINWGVDRFTIDP